MKTLILNSGLGSRMGDITKNHPKCMTQISDIDTILSRQLKLIKKCSINNVVITTGYYDKVLIDYCHSLNLGLNYEFINNNKYRETNYIYSIYCAKDYLEDDMILMHGDLVFEESILQDIIKSNKSVMTVSSTLTLPEKDFKAVIENNHISKVGINYFDNAVAAQPLYRLNKEDWLIWLDSISKFCEGGNTKVYAENAFNEVSDKCLIYPFDVKDELCNEIDNPEDLENVKKRIK